MLVPYVLEVGGVLPPSMRISDGTVVLLPRMTQLPSAPIEAMLVIGSVLMVALPSFVTAEMNDRRLDTKLRLFAHLWHLRQLVPAGARQRAMRTTGRQPPVPAPRSKS